MLLGHHPAIFIVADDIFEITGLPVQSHRQLAVGESGESMLQGLNCSRLQWARPKLRYIMGYESICTTML